jgi:hypothetical protein
LDRRDCRLLGQVMHSFRQPLHFVAERLGANENRTLYLMRLDERMDEQGFDESDRLRCLVAEARETLEKIGIELSTLAIDCLKLPSLGTLTRKRELR